MCIISLIKMKFFSSQYLIGLLMFSICYADLSQVTESCANKFSLKEDDLLNLSKTVVPDLEGKVKGEAGKIAVIGGSTEYTGAPYFAAMSALKVGADLVYVITTESAAQVIKTYSPDLIVHPILNAKYRSKISSLLSKVDVIVIGPGLGREDETMTLIYEIMQTCKDLKKPLVIDADGIYALSKNLTVIKNYPSPGVILTPNHKEAKLLQQGTFSNNNTVWYDYWGAYVAVLVKAEHDHYFSSEFSMQWHLLGGSGRRAAGQGDILAGAMGTFYNWALKANICKNTQLAQTIASYAAAKLTRACNFKAYQSHGRSMIASDMLNKIHDGFDTWFL